MPDELTVQPGPRTPGASRTRQADISSTAFPAPSRRPRRWTKFQTLDAVVNFAIDDELVISRLSGREICKICGAIYHVKNMPSKVKGVCDKCGGQLYTRPDDSIESITNRLDVYKKQTEPLINYYRKKKLLRDIDSSKSPEDTLAQIRKALGKPR